MTVKWINYQPHMCHIPQRILFKNIQISVICYDEYSAGSIYKYLSFFHKEIRDLWPIICLKLHVTEAKNELGTWIGYLKDQ